MKLDVFPSPHDIYLADKDKENAYFVVIDVLRATTTITTALLNGATSVIPFESEEDVLAYKNAHPDMNFITGGEKDYAKIQNFDLGNSPQSYARTLVLEKNILLATTNGTIAINKAAAKGNVCLACLNNASAVKDHLLKLEYQEKNIYLVCSGRNGNLALEDILCAGLIVDKISSEKNLLGNFSMTDSAFIARSFYEKYRGAIESGLVHSESGRKLISMGQQLDVDFCAKIDTAFAIPVVKDGAIVLEQLLTKKFKRVD